MLESPRLSVSVAWGLLAVLCWWLAGYGLATPLNVLPGMGSFVFGLAAAVNGIDFLLFKWSLRVRLFYEAKATTERVRVIQLLGALNDEQLKALGAGAVEVNVLGGSPGPLFTLTVGEGKIPYSFIREFLSQGDDTYLCPVGLYSEGTKRREWAQWLTAYFIMFGFAERASGNRSARWANKGAALAYIGLNSEYQVVLD